MALIVLTASIVDVDSHAQAREGDSDTVATVVIVSMMQCCARESWPQAESDLRAELSLLDLQVEVVAGAAVGERSRRAELEEVSRDRGAVAALRIIRPVGGTEGGVEIWLADRITGKTTYRKIDLSADENRGAATIVAVRAVEALRASLLELRIVGPEKTEATPPQEIVALVENVQLQEPEGSMTFGFSASGSVAVSPGDTGPRVGFRISALWIPIPALAIEADGALWPFGPAVVAHDASTAMDAAALRGWALWQMRRSGLVRPAIGFGGGIWFAWVRGIEAKGGKLRSDQARAGYIGTTVRLYLAVAEHLWLTAGVQVGVLVPELRVFHGDDQAARFGQPVFESLLGVESRFP